MSSIPQVSLGELLRLERRPVMLVPDSKYSEIGTYSHGRGIFHKAPRTGAEVGDKQLFIIKEGDFILQITFAWEGAVALASKSEEGMYGSVRFLTFRVNEARCYPPYLVFYFRTHGGLDQLGKISPGSAGRNRVLSVKRIPEVLVPLPPVPEQRRIVGRIKELSAKIEEAYGLRQYGQEAATALLEASVGELMSEAEIHAKEQLKKLTSKIGSGSTPSGGRSAYPASGVPFIRSLNVRMRSFRWENIAHISPETHAQMAGTHVRPTDVLLNITGASIGRVACAPTELNEGNVNQHVAIIRPCEKLEPRYLMYWLSQPTIQRFINDEQKGATRAGFTKAQIEDLLIPVPPLPEQRRIVAYVDDLQAKVDAVKKIQDETAEELNAMMPSILSRAFSGEL